MMLLFWLIGAAQAADLTWQLQEGQVLRYRTTIDVRVVATFQGDPLIDRVEHYEHVVRHEVTSVDADGKATLRSASEATSGRYLDDVEGQDISWSFPGQVLAPGDSLSAELTRAMADVMKLTETTTLGPSGEAVLVGGGGPQLASFGLPMPGEVLAVGERWAVSHHVSTFLGAAEMSGHGVVGADDVVEGTPCTRFTVSLDHVLEDGRVAHQDAEGCFGAGHLLTLTTSGTQHSPGGTGGSPPPMDVSVSMTLAWLPPGAPSVPAGAQSPGAAPSTEVLQTEWIGRKKRGDPPVLWELLAHPDGTRVRGVDRTGRATEWSVPDGRELGVVPGVEDRDGYLDLVAGWDGDGAWVVGSGATVRRHEGEQLQDLGPSLPEEIDLRHVDAAAVLPDGLALADEQRGWVVGGDGEVRWSWEDRTVCGLVPDGDRLLLLGTQTTRPGPGERPVTRGVASVRDLRTGDELLEVTLSEHTCVGDLVGDRLVVVPATENHAVVYDVPSGEERVRVSLPDEGIDDRFYALALSPDGRWLAGIFGGDRRLARFDVGAGRPARQLRAQAQSQKLPPLLEVAWAGEHLLALPVRDVRIVRVVPDEGAGEP